MKYEIPIFLIKVYKVYNTKAKIALMLNYNFIV